MLARRASGNVSSRARQMRTFGGQEQSWQWRATSVNLFACTSSPFGETKRNCFERRPLFGAVPTHLSILMPDGSWFPCGVPPRATEEVPTREASGSSGGRFLIRGRARHKSHARIQSHDFEYLFVLPLFDI